MKAIAFRKASSLSAADCLVDVERQPPVPGSRDLRVAVRAVSVNPVDTKVRIGSVSVPDDVDALGWDVAGTVEAVGATAWQLLFHRLGVAPGKSPDAGTLLIVGGAGGVGSMLIQLASRLYWPHCDCNRITQGEQKLVLVARCAPCH